MARPYATPGSNAREWVTPSAIEVIGKESPKFALFGPAALREGSFKVPIEKREGTRLRSCTGEAEDKRSLCQGVENNAKRLLKGIRKAAYRDVN